MNKVSFNFKAEELEHIGEFVRTSFINDQQDFVDFSPRYDNTFLDDFDQKMRMLKECTSPVILTKKLAKTTTSLYNTLDNVADFLGDLGRYIEMAGSIIPLSIKDLDIPVLRKKCRNRDAEGVVKGLNTVKQLITPHLSALENEGFTSEKQTQIDTFISDINSDNKQQNELLNQRSYLVDSNITLLNDFWKMVQDLLKSGKVIYKKNPVKKKEYTKSDILKRLRHTESE